MFGTTLFILVVLAYFSRFSRPVSLHAETTLVAERPRVPDWWGGAAAAAVAFCLALYHLGSRSFWGDEAFSVTLALKPAAEFWRVVSESQANMSLYYVLLHAWTRLDDGETTVRLLSVLAAALAVFVLYAAAARL